MEEEDAYSDDSSESESELQQNIEQLQAAIEGSPFHYDSHVQLIGLLRQLGDLDGARKARNAMSDVFPLNEDLWLEWLRDELPLGSVAEAGMELRQLFERATQDYLSTAVWLLYAQFAVDQMSLSPDGVEFPRDVFEGAIVSCGLHVSKAGELWDTYREFETAVFTSLQQMQQNSLEDESLKSQVEAQYERVDKLFKRQLAVPLIGMQDTLTQYQQFSESATSEDSLPAYSRALKRLEAVLPFENDLSSSSPPSLDAYRSYISHIKTSKEDPMFINTLYQRAMADHCLEVHSLTVLKTSGMQMFDGEDLKYEKRKKLQHEQMREWTAAQIAEKERLQSEQQHADRLYDLKACELDQRAVDLACADTETRKNITVATKEYNLALAKEKAAQQQQDLAQEQDDNLTELCNHVHGDTLTENPAVAQSAFGSHRVIPDRWKGMSPKQVHEVRATQEQQKAEKKRLLSEECEREKEWNRRRLAEARAGLVLESQLNRQKRDEVMKLARENKQMAEEQQARERYLQKEVYVNVPSEGYFSQFNTSSR